MNEMKKIFSPPSQEEPDGVLCNPKSGWGNIVFEDSPKTVCEMNEISKSHKPIASKFLSMLDVPFIADCWHQVKIFPNEN